MDYPDRRHSPRVDMEEPLRARIVSLGIDCLVLDASEGGMLVETDRPFALGEEHEFLVITDDLKNAAVFTARAVYSHRRSASTTNPTYASGFGFLSPDDPGVRQTVLALIDNAGGVVDQPTSLRDFLQFWHHHR
jgi:hypothetical protein